MSLTQLKRAKRAAVMLSAALGALALAVTSRAADVLPGWGSWSLPPNHSVHGASIDLLFWWIFWITMIVWILVTLIWGIGPILYVLLAKGAFW